MGTYLRNPFRPYGDDATDSGDAGGDIGIPSYLPQDSATDAYGNDPSTVAAAPAATPMGGPAPSPSTSALATAASVLTAGAAATGIITKLVNPSAPAATTAIPASSTASKAIPAVAIVAAVGLGAFIFLRRKRAA